MPLYEFSCDDCGHAFEVMAAFTDLDEASACPSCDGANTRRLFGGVQLAGRRASIKPQNFVRPHGPVAGRDGGATSS